jgi:hypothetical protein
MQRNVGRIDRRARGLLLAPLGLLVAVLVGPTSIVGVIVLVLAAVLAVTAAVGFCPLYALLRIDSCPAGDRR